MAERHGSHHGPLKPNAKRTREPPAAIVRTLAPIALELNRPPALTHLEGSVLVGHCLEKRGGGIDAENLAHLLAQILEQELRPVGRRTEITPATPPRLRIQGR